MVHSNRAKDLERLAELTEAEEVLESAPNIVFVAKVAPDFGDDPRIEVRVVRDGNSFHDVAYEIAAVAIELLNGHRAQLASHISQRRRELEERLYPNSQKRPQGV